MPPSLKKAWAPLLLIIALALVNSSLIFCGRTLLNIAPSNALLPGKPYGYQGPQLDWTTTVDPVGSFGACYPADAYSTVCLKQGVIPFWNPYQGLGQPFLGSGFPAVFYPVNWLHMVLPPAWWDLVFLLNWLLGSLFLYSYLRLIELEPRASLVGASAMFACCAIQIYLPLREVPAVAAWWPLLLYAVERTYRQPGWRARHLVLAVAIFCSVAAGQPEATFVSLLAGAAYALFRLVSARKRALTLILGLAPGAAAGLLLSAPHWLNFVDYAFTCFSEHTPGAGKGLIHQPFHNIASYFFPYFYGRIQHFPFGTNIFDWRYSPGWLAPLCLFLALASLSGFRIKPKPVVGFLWIVSILALAKMFGVPGINSLGSLPYLELVIFPRYAAFVPAFALAGPAAYGISLLARADNRTWRFWIIVWMGVVSVAFTLGLVSIRSALSAPGAEARKTLVVFGLGGLAWSVVQPLSLWWIRHRRGPDSHVIYGFAAFGLLLNGVALAPNGYSIKTYAALSVSGLIVNILAATAIGFIPNPRATLGMTLAGFSTVGLLPILAATLGAYGLPNRYNPLTPPPYVAALLDLQAGGSYRSYSMGAVPGPDFAGPLQLSSLDNLDALSPVGAARFLQDYLDPGLSGTYFVGHRSSIGPPYMSALDWIKSARRYYSLAAVKYLVSTDVLTSGADINTYDSLAVFLGSAHPVPITSPLRSALVPTTDQISTIEVLIGTYGKQNPGVLELQVLDQQGSLLESSRVSGSDLIDNAYCTFHLSAINQVKGKHLELLLEFRPDSKDSMVAAYVPPDPSVIGFAFRVPSTEPDFRMIYKDQETGTAVWENPDATPRVFLAPEIKTASSDQDALSRLKDITNLTRTVLVPEGLQTQSDPDPARPAGFLREFQLSPNEVTIKYSAGMAGILTLADSFSPGWRAEVNGKESPVISVDGIFRGVKIETPGEVYVHFWYRPPRWNLSLVLCGLGLIILAIPLVSLIAAARRAQ